MVEAILYRKDHEDEAKETLVEQLKLSPEQAQAQVIPSNFVPEINTDSIASIQDVMLEQGSIDRTVDRRRWSGGRQRDRACATTRKWDVNVATRLVQASARVLVILAILGLWQYLSASGALTPSSFPRMVGTDAKLGRQVRSADLWLAMERRCAGGRRAWRSAARWPSSRAPCWGSTGSPTPASSP